MELLAPAGTIECVYAAVKCGADAVYFAGQSFGARSYAGNLSADEIAKAADYCHLRGVKVYVTVNTLVFDREFKELEKFIKAITRAGVDAVIVQDMGVLKYIREISPDLELHASTQMTVHSADGVRLLEKLGVSRVVLARELSDTEIQDIISGTSAEAEVFVHGAMCMSYSGQCLMSSVIGGRSGNRGKCAQPCRLPYSPNGRDSRFYMSLKDMSYADHIAELEKMGVASLKIEGRMKGEAYVSSVVSAYRRLMDEKRLPTKSEKEELNRVFFRGGLTDGYYTGSIGKHMFAFDKPDNPYLKNDVVIPQKTEKTVPVEIYADICEGDFPKIKLISGSFIAEATGDEPVASAQKRPLLRENVCAQLEKTGGTAFCTVKTELNMSQNPFMPLSAVNELRRKGFCELERRMLEKYKSKSFENFSFKAYTDTVKGPKGFTCSVCNIEQYRALCGEDMELFFVPLHIAEQNLKELAANCEKIVITLPAIIRGEKRRQYRERLLKLKNAGFNKVEISTVDGFCLCDGFEKYGGFRLNVANSISASEYIRLGLESVAMSPELNLAQLRGIKIDGKTELMAYGRASLMLCENCIIKNMDKCKEGCGGEITDRTGARLPIIKDGDICRSVVLNSVPLYMGDKLDDLYGTNADFMRLVFTTESGKECKKIYEMYCARLPSESDFTRLHYYKGVM